MIKQKNEQKPEFDEKSYDVSYQEFNSEFDIK